MRGSSLQPGRLTVFNSSNSSSESIMNGPQSGPIKPIKQAQIKDWKNSTCCLLRVVWWSYNLKLEICFLTDSRGRCCNYLIVKKLQPVIHLTKGSQLCICYFCTKPLFLSFLPPYSFWWPLCYLLCFPLWPQSSLPIPPSHHSNWLRLPTNQSMVTVSQPVHCWFVKNPKRIYNEKASYCKW